MGARLLKRWILMPLKELKPIRERHEVVATLYARQELREALMQEASQIGDLERLISKIGLLKANPREMVQFKRALYAVEKIRQILSAHLADDDATAAALAPATKSGGASDALRAMAEALDVCRELRDRLERELQPEPPVQVARGGVIAEDVDPELD